MKKTKVLHNQAKTMKINFSLLLLIFTFSCVASFSQVKESDEKPPLFTEFVELIHINIKTIGKENNGDVVNSIFDYKSNEFIQLIKNKLTKRGSVEVGYNKDKTILVLTDERNNLDAVIKYIKLFDVPSESADAQLYTEYVQIKKIPWCSNNKKCGQIMPALNYLKPVIARRLSRKGKVEIDEAQQSVVVTDFRLNLETIKNFIEWIDTEDFYNLIESDKK